MHHDFVQIEGRKHPVVREFLEFYQGLEEVVGWESINVENFRHVSGGPDSPEYEVLGLDNQKGILIIVGENASYRQRFSVAITDDNKSGLIDFIKSDERIRYRKG